MRRVIAAMMMALAGMLAVAVMPVSAAGNAWVDCDKLNDDAQKAAAGCNESRNGGDVAVNLVNGVISLVGLVAVVFIIIGGIRYQLSQGDASRAKAAKDTILYAIIGLVVAALAWAIVNFVIGAFSS